MYHYLEGLGTRRAWLYAKLGFTCNRKIKVSTSWASMQVNKAHEIGIILGVVVWACVFYYWTKLSLGVD